MKKVKGFTIIELMIVIAIIGVLATYAMSAYTKFVIIAKRTDAKKAISIIAGAEEKVNTVNGSYVTTIAGSGVDGTSLGLGGADFNTSPDYTYAVTVDGNNVYTITSTAIGATQPGDVIYDGICTTMTLDSTGIMTPITCWQN